MSYPFGFFGHLAPAKAKKDNIQVQKTKEREKKKNLKEKKKKKNLQQQAADDCNRRQLPMPILLFLPVQF